MFFNSSFCWCLFRKTHFGKAIFNTIPFPPRSIPLSLLVTPSIRSDRPLPISLPTVYKIFTFSYMNIPLPIYNIIPLFNGEIKGAANLNSQLLELGF